MIPAFKSDLFEYWKTHLEMSSTYLALTWWHDLFSQSLSQFVQLRYQL